MTFTRRIGAACETAQNSVPDWQPAWPVTLMVRFEIERQKLFSAMQALRVRVGVGGGRLALVRDVDRAVDRDVGRALPEAGDLRVVADLEGQRVLGAAVRAGLEEQRDPLVAELVRDLLRGDGVDLRLDLLDRLARVEDVHGGAEVGVAGGVVTVRRGGRRADGGADGGGGGAGRAGGEGEGRRGEREGGRRGERPAAQGTRGAAVGQAARGGDLSAGRASLPGTTYFGGPDPLPSSAA
ncbi:hypothetical protein GCM10025868_17080 [Angustibacter aerolatus]|uniref:Uncharacterized protein n=1 Tax=Angustibacter aerolatus TaxID=1162965 RepID=A0ABQ6JE66_9ACTN|nr:hypothetical protein GCM10025868_17080 [Angustibacter aerolatus]